MQALRRGLGGSMCYWEKLCGFKMKRYRKKVCLKGLLRSQKQIQQLGQICILMICTKLKMLLLIFATAILAGTLHATLTTFLVFLATQAPSTQFIHAVMKMHRCTHTCRTVDEE